RMGGGGPPRLLCRSRGGLFQRVDRPLHGAGQAMDLYDQRSKTAPAQCPSAVLRSLGQMADNAGFDTRLTVRPLPPWSTEADKRSGTGPRRRHCRAIDMFLVDEILPLVVGHPLPTL